MITFQSYGLLVTLRHSCQFACSAHQPLIRAGQHHRLAAGKTLLEVRPHRGADTISTPYKMVNVTLPRDRWQARTLLRDFDPKTLSRQPYRLHPNFRIVSDADRLQKQRHGVPSHGGRRR
ncbi:hypothetical protein PUG42_20585 [Erwiniaceae bacterium L1_54_3]|nr:hypothetical protein [Pantoea formicae]MDF7650935.1 hypothetical protein [Erwiniaceae bacterium L1_54_3]